MKNRKYGKIIVICLSASIAATFFFWPSPVALDGTLNDAEAAKIIESGPWHCTGYEALSPSTGRFSMQYAEKHRVEFLLGIQSVNSQFYPQPWRHFSEKKAALAFRELATVEGILYKWQVYISHPDGNAARNTITFTYLVGGKSAYTYTGAGLWRGIGAFFALRSYPCGIIKVHIPSQRSSATAKEIVDSFRTRVVPRLHELLEQRHALLFRRSN